MTFAAKNIYYLRTKMHKSQSDTGIAANVRANTISNWENDKGEPSASELLKLCQFFDVSVDDFLCIDLEKDDLNQNITRNKAGKKGDVIVDPKGDLNEDDVETAGLLHMINEPISPYDNPLLKYIKQISQDIERTRVLLEQRLPKEDKKSAD